MSAVTSSDMTTQGIGKELLADLINSDLGSDEDRDLAYRIARTDLGDKRVDDALSIGDNEEDNPGEQV